MYLATGVIGDERPMHGMNYHESGHVYMIEFADDSQGPIKYYMSLTE